MAYLEVLLQKLKNRATNVMNARAENFSGEVKIFYDFISDNDILGSIIEELEIQGIDLTEFNRKAELGQAGNISLPDDYTKKICLCNEVMKLFAKKELDCRNFANFTSSSNIHEICEEMAKKYFYPLYEYIIEKIESFDYFLYMLLRYKKKIEWFNRDELLRVYEEDKRHGEDNLTKNLQEYLYDQGVDYPFSTPKSPRGRTDLVSLVDSTKPVPLEVKLFSKKRSVEYIKKGIRQAYRYATDYSESIGYLLIFNLDDIELIIKNADREGNFYRIEIGKVTIFIIIVNISKILEPASKETGIDKYTIDAEYLKELNDI